MLIAIYVPSLDILEQQTTWDSICRI